MSIDWRVNNDIVSDEKSVLVHQLSLCLWYESIEDAQVNNGIQLSATIVGCDWAK